MKKLEIVTGMFLGIVFAVAVFFVLDKFPRWELLATILLCALAIAYAIYRVRLFEKGTSALRTVDSKAIGFGISTIYMGGLFVKMHWFGTVAVFMVGLIVIFGIVVVSFIYPNVKKLEIIAGIFFGIMFAVAVFFLLNMFPGWNLLATISLCALGLVYALFGVKFFDNGTSALRTVASKATGLGLSTIFIGALSEIMGWTGGTVILIIGLIVTFAIVFASFIFRSQNDFFETILLRVVIIGGFGLLVCFIPDLPILKIQYKDCPSCIEAYKRYLEISPSEARKQLKIEYYRTTSNSEIEFMFWMQTMGIDYEDVSY